MQYPSRIDMKICLQTLRNALLKTPWQLVLKFQGLGPKCPYYLDPSRNDVTGREIKDKATIEYIVKLHNEVRSKIARGWCDQPKAGCMGPVVSECHLFVCKPCIPVIPFFSMEFCHSLRSSLSSIIDSTRALVDRHIKQVSNSSFVDHGISSYSTVIDIIVN